MRIAVGANGIVEYKTTRGGSSGESARHPPMWHGFDCCLDAMSELGLLVLYSALTIFALHIQALGYSLLSSKPTCEFINFTDLFS